MGICCIKKFTGFIPLDPHTKGESREGIQEKQQGRKKKVVTRKIGDGGATEREERE
jgi:hypothetical protein